MATFFHNFFYLPLYNLLAALVDVMPGGDVGLAVVAATLVVKIVLFPLSYSAARTQRKMQHITPKLNELKELHKDDKEKQLKETMALYKEHGVNPFGPLVILLQFPIIIALYAVFRAHVFASIDPASLYTFVPAPHTLSPLLFGLLPVSGSSIILALVTALVQYVFARYFMPSLGSTGSAPGMQADMARMMTMQMRYFFPVFMGIAAYVGGGAVALYLITSTLFGIGQQWLVNRLVKPIG